MSMASLAPLARNRALGAIAALRGQGSMELTSWRTRGLSASRLAACASPGGVLVTSYQKSTAPIRPTTTEILGSSQASTTHVLEPMDTPATPMRDKSTSDRADRASMIRDTSRAVCDTADWCTQIA